MNPLNRLWRLAGVTFTTLLLAAPPGIAQEADNAPAPTRQHYINTVFVIMMENHNWKGDTHVARNIARNTLAEYVNFTLMPAASHPEEYFNAPKMHPSLPNYLWLEAGTNFGLMKSVRPATHTLTTHEHLTALLDKAGISWKAYDERATGTVCPLQAWHTPFVFFSDVTGNANPHSAKCIAHIRPLREMSTDLAANTVARYNFIVPNLCHSMQSSCNGGDPITQGDEWLSTTVPGILNSTAFRSGGALFIIWDEALHGDGPIPMIVLSPYAKGNGYANTIHYTHGSTLRTLQEIFGVGPLMRDAAKQTDLRDLFTVFP